MGKRKHKKDAKHYVKRKIKKLMRRLENSDSSEDSSDSIEVRRPTSPASYNDRNGEENSDIELCTDLYSRSPSPNGDVRIRSTVEIPSLATVPPSEELPQPQQSQADASISTVEPVEQLSTIILEALGDAKGKPEIFGPKIQEEISKRWGRILSEGLNRDLKRNIMEKILVPENFQLVKAPKLNPEIAAVLTESAINRDKRQEKTQHHLGKGIAGLTNVISILISGDIDKIDLIKSLSEINQLLLDLHFENSINRRKLITPILDKKFLNIVQDVQRDAWLFGDGLGDKIKATKTAEKSGLQVRKSSFRSPAAAATSSKTGSQQGNWRGQARQAHHGSRPVGAKRYPNSNYQTTKRSTFASDRYNKASKTIPKSTPKNN